MSSKTLSFKIYYGDQLVDTQELSQDVIKIGKLKSSHLCLDDDSVARMHAVIEVSGDEVRVIDLGSSAGTVLNGQQIDKNSVLSDGDTLVFGPYRLEVAFLQPQVMAAPAQPAAVGMAAAAAMPRHAPVSRAPIQIDAGEYEVQDGSRVAEVVAMYGSTVLDVQHVGQIKSKRSQAPLWLALGGLMIIGGVGVFGYEVSRPWEQYKADVLKANTTGGVMPQKPGMGLGGVGIGLALLGLIPLTLGMTRLNEIVHTSYTIGEGHHATFHVPTSGLPDATAFPIVRGGGHEFSLNFTGEMDGEVTFDGQTIPLQQLVSSGRAGAAGSSYSFPIPPGANCRVAYRDMTFYVNSVPPGAVVAASSEADKPFWLFNGGSFAVIGTLLVSWSHLIPPEEELSHRTCDELMAEDNRFVGYMNQPERDRRRRRSRRPRTWRTPTTRPAATGQRHKGEEGKMGKPTSKQKSGLYAMKGPKNAIPQMARNFDPEMMAPQRGYPRHDGSRRAVTSSRRPTGLRSPSATTTRTSGVA